MSILFNTLGLMLLQVPGHFRQNNQWMNSWESFTWKELELTAPYHEVRVQSHLKTIKDLKKGEKWRPVYSMSRVRQHSTNWSRNVLETSVEEHKAPRLQKDTICEEQQSSVNKHLWETTGLISLMAVVHAGKMEELTLFWTQNLSRTPAGVSRPPRQLQAGIVRK